VHDPALHFLRHLVRALLAQRAVHVAGQAEAAAARAAAHHLDAQTVVRDLGRGDERLLGHVARVQGRHEAEARPRDRRARQRLPRDEAPGILHLSEERGHVDALERGHAAQRFGARHLGAAPLGGDVAQLHHDLFAVAHYEGVDEGRDGLRVHRAEAARDHDRVVLAAVLRPKGHPGEVDHREHVGVGQLVLQREADQVERAGGRPRFERVEGDPLGAHQLLHVAPRREAELREPVLAAVDQVVEDLQPEIGHPDLVQVREAEEHPDRSFRRILPERVEEATRVPARLGDRRQVGFVQQSQFFHVPLREEAVSKQLGQRSLWQTGRTRPNLPSRRIYHTGGAAATRVENAGSGAPGSPP
jgi:hypothetical protein